MKASRLAVSFGVALFGVVAVATAWRLNASEVVPVAELARQTHIHGLAVDRQDPSRLLIATHHGLFRAGPDGRAERISVIQDFMGFNPHPSESNKLFASGHPAGGGNLGFIASDDGGATWTQVAPGADGPVDFHQIAVSPADPNRIYGSYKGLQISDDGGKRWRINGPAPEGLIDLAGSAKELNTLYAATEGGLLMSTDAGKRWAPLLQGQQVSLVEVTPDGYLYAFVVGRGLLRSSEPPIELQQVSSSLADEVLLHLAGDPANPDRLFAATAKSKVLTSADRGRTWAPLGQSRS